MAVSEGQFVSLGMLGLELDYFCKQETRTPLTTQRLDQRFYVLTINFEIPQVAYF